jgi:hypothetical protein
MIRHTRCTQVTGVCALPICPPRPKPIITRPLLSPENIEGQVPFSLGSRTDRSVQQPLPSSENMTCTIASFSSGDSTLCPSPLSDLGDLPPLKNLPSLLLDPQIPEQIQVKKRPMTANFPIKARNPFKFRRTSTSSAPSPTSRAGETLPVYPPIDRSPTPPVELGCRKPSLMKRLNLPGRRVHSVNVVVECAFSSQAHPFFPPNTSSAPSSAPTSPMLPPSSFRDAKNTSKRSASVEIPPPFTPPSPHQGSPRRTLLSSLTRRPRTASLSEAPSRTQPYGPPYNCPLPVPQPRRSSGTRRPAIRTQLPMPAS